MAYGDFWTCRWCKKEYHQDERPKQCDHCGRGRFGFRLHGRVTPLVDYRRGIREDAQGATEFVCDFCKSPCGFTPPADLICPHCGKAGRFFRLVPVEDEGIGWQEYVLSSEEKLGAWRRLLAAVAEQARRRYERLE